LDALHDGRNVPSNLAEDLDLTRQHIQKRLKRLEEHGYIRNIGRGVYELVEDPRE
jgi:predicted transcriptional regulator